MAFLSVTDPADWPLTMPELKTIDTLLRCSICYEFFDIAMMLPKCSHNYCSVCIRRYLTYKNLCPTCNTPAEAAQLCNNRALDQLVANFKAVRPHILKLCKEDAVKNEKETDLPIISPPSRPLVGDKRKRERKKSSPLRRQSNPDSDGDFMPDNHVAVDADTPRRKLQKRSNYKFTRDKIASQATEMTTDSTDETNQETKPAQNKDLHHTDPPGGQSSSSSTSSSPPSKTLNRPTEENIDPTYQPADDGDSDDDVITIATPSKPSTSHGEASSSSSGAILATRSEKVGCPICGVPISSKHINSHLDACLTKSEEKEKRKRVPKRKTLPKLVFTLMKEKELRKRLKDFGLNTQGQRPMMTKRLNDFTLMYNAQCDSDNPVSVEALVKEFNRVEKLKTQPANPSLQDQRLKVSRSHTDEQIDKSQQQYLKTHGSHFQDLIQNMKQRMKGKSKKSANGADNKNQSDTGSSTDTTTSQASSALDTGDESVAHDISLDEESVAKDNSIVEGFVARDVGMDEESVARDSDVVEAPAGRLGENNADGSDKVLNSDQGQANVRTGSDDVGADCIAADNSENYNASSDDVVARKLKVKVKPNHLSLSRRNNCSNSDVVILEKGQVATSNDADNFQNRTLLDVKVLGGGAVAIATGLENSEEQMDMMEDDMSPVFGRCSGQSGGSRDGETKAAGPGRGEEHQRSSVKLDFEGHKSSDQKETAASLAPEFVPPPPNLLLLNEVDTISEGSSLATLETLSEASGSLGNMPSPPDVTCIPERHPRASSSRGGEFS